MKFEMSGFDKLEKQLKQLEKNANKIDGTNEVPFSEMFNPSFMTKYTNFSSIDLFFDASPFTCETNEDLEAIPEDELDVFVNENTSFSTWQDMLGKAGEEWTVKQLGF